MNSNLHNHLAPQHETLEAKTLAYWKLSLVWYGRAPKKYFVPTGRALQVLREHVNTLNAQTSKLYRVSYRLQRAIIGD